MKYFGFQSDGSGKITSKKEIICRICKAVITYCGNTTNMSYHMQQQHKEMNQAAENQVIATMAALFASSSVKHEHAITAFITSSVQPLSIIRQILCCLNNYWKATSRSKTLCDCHRPVDSTTPATCIYISHCSFCGYKSKCLQTSEIVQHHTAESLKKVLTDMHVL